MYSDYSGVFVNGYSYNFATMLFPRTNNYGFADKYHKSYARFSKSFVAWQTYKTADTDLVFNITPDTSFINID